MLSILKGPYLQWPTQDSVTIKWETSCPASSKVTYWETRKVHVASRGSLETVTEAERTVADPALSDMHEVRLTDLAPDTTYHYRVSSRNAEAGIAESAMHPLKTAVHQHEPFSFIVISEMGGAGDREATRKLFAQIARYRPEFLLIVGDAAGGGSRYEDWERSLFGPGRELFFDTPFYLCLGNHERLPDCEQGLALFSRFVAYPEPKRYYSFDYGNAHFVALDSTSAADYDGLQYLPEQLGKELTPGSPQYEFLVRDLSSTRATWRFVFFHYPPYVSGSYETEAMRVLCPVFEQHGVNMVFNSHTIVYERSHPLRDGRVDTESGVTYVVAGGAGMRPSWFDHKRSWHTAQALAVPHMVQVVIAGETLELRAVDDEGRLFDIMTLRKRPEA